MTNGLYGQWSSFWNVWVGLAVTLLYAWQQRIRRVVTQCADRLSWIITSSTRCVPQRCRYLCGSPIVRARGCSTLIPSCVDATVLGKAALSIYLPDSSDLASMTQERICYSWQCWHCWGILGQGTQLKLTFTDDQKTFASNKCTLRTILYNSRNRIGQSQILYLPTYHVLGWLTWWSCVHYMASSWCQIMMIMIGSSINFKFRKVVRTRWRRRGSGCSTIKLFQVGGDEPRGAESDADDPTIDPREIFQALPFVRSSKYDTTSIR